MVAVRATLGKHLFELLLLRIIQCSFQFALAILHDGPCLCVAILWGERGVGAKALHLLPAIREDRRNLRHLIAVESEPLAQVCGLLSRIERAVLAARLRLPGLRSVRDGGLVAFRRLCKQDARREQCAQNDCCFCRVHTLDSPFRPWSS